MNLSRRSALTALSLALLAAAHGCGRTELAGPPELRVGRDECAECGMIISEDRCSSAFLIERHGVREHTLFDDIGCMLDYERRGPEGVRIVEGFVHDHGTRAWVPAAAAVFLFADREELPTPMGSGIVAFADAAAAEKARAEFGGQTMDYARLGPARREWMEARYGKQEDRP